MRRAFSIIEPVAQVPLFIFGDHASNYIPSELNNLGLSGEDLTRHIAWDIGTAELIDGLCQSFGCRGMKASISRLVIDMHRDPVHNALIPERSDGTQIPANKELSLEARKARLKLHTTYHKALAKCLDDLTAHDPLIVSMHSFTPKPRTGEARDVDIGLLCKADWESAERVSAALRPRFHVALNEPYSAFDLYYTLERHVIERGWRHLMFEVRQDLVDTDAKVKDMGAIIARVLKPLV